MKQAEIWEVYFDPVLGSEQAGRRPALIISGNLAGNDDVNVAILYLFFVNI